MKVQRGKVSSAVTFVAVVVIVGGVLGAMGYWYGKKDASKSNQNSIGQASAKTTTTPVVDRLLAESGSNAAIPCTSSVNPKTFFSKLIGLEFCYPKEWGEATVGNVPASASDKGLAYEITFSTNPKVTVASATTDYVNTIGRGGRCADPVTQPPDYSTYVTTWKVQGNLGDIQIANRDIAKEDGVYRIHEQASDFGGNVCLTGYIEVPGGAYTLITANIQAEYGGEISTVNAHVSNPIILISPSERIQFGELVKSIKKAT